jgi:hypothetical protein
VDSLSRKPQCPVTCRDGVIRPPRGGAPSCGTKHLRSVRSVSAKQVGSCELAGAPPRCGVASLAGLSSHRRPCTRCGHIALPIVQIGASPKGVACPAPPRSTPQSGTHWTWPVDDFHRIAQGHHREAAWHSRIAHDHPLSHAEPNGPQFLYGDCTVRLPRTIRNTAKVRSGWRAMAVCDRRFDGLSHQEISAQLCMSMTMVMRYSKHIDQERLAREANKRRS